MEIKMTQTCARCAARAYTPTGMSQKYCPECAAATRTRANGLRKAVKKYQC